MSLIQTEVLTSTSEFNRLRPLWNDTLQRSGLTNPFLRHEWLSAWWHGYGQDKELFVVSFKEGDCCIGFAPLARYTTHLTGVPVQVIGFLANHWTRMDFILAEQRKECLARLCDLIKDTRDVFLLTQVDSRGENFPLFIELLTSHRLVYHTTSKPHAFIALKGTWDDYFNRQSKNFRMDARRKLKRLSNAGEVALKRHGSCDDAMLVKLKAIAAGSWQAGDQVNIIASPEGEKFYTQVISDLCPEGCLDVSILHVDERAVAYMVGLRHNDTYFAFDTAYDAAFHNFSPGLVLHNLLIERLYKEGIRCLDLGYTASYKKRWSEEVTMMTDIVIYPADIKGKILSFIKRLSLKVRKEDRRRT